MTQYLRRLDLIESLRGDQHRRRLSANAQDREQQLYPGDHRRLRRAIEPRHRRRPQRRIHGPRRTAERRSRSSPSASGSSACRRASASTTFKPRKRPGPTTSSRCAFPSSAPGCTTRNSRSPSKSRASRMSPASRSGRTRVPARPQGGKFKGAGDHPQDCVEFEIDVQELKKIKAADDKNGDLEGEWHIVAKVPRHREGAVRGAGARDRADQGAGAEAGPARAVCLPAGRRANINSCAPSSTAKWSRSAWRCASTCRRARKIMSIRSVEPERMLADFPNKLGPDDPGPARKFMSLNDYDVIIAFDPDWTKLSPTQIDELEGMGRRPCRRRDLRRRAGLSLINWPGQAAAT